VSWRHLSISQTGEMRMHRDVDDANERDEIFFLSKFLSLAFVGARIFAENRKRPSLITIPALKGEWGDGNLSLPAAI
jgi:hypothetical protein